MIGWRIPSIGLRRNFPGGWRQVFASLSSESAAKVERDELVTCELVSPKNSDGKSLVAKLTFNSPKRLNALTVPMSAVFGEKVKQLIELQQDLRAVILTGAGK